MSITSWLDATISNVAPLGQITTFRRFNATTVMWNYGSKSVYLGEDAAIGSKLAKYNVLNNPSVIAQIRTLEAEAKKQAELLALAKDDAELAHLLGVEMDTEADDFGPFVTESDPYIALSL